jgi:hypothetical protein
MTPPKKDGYSLAVTTGLQSVLFGSQFATFGHKNMHFSHIFTKSAKEKHPHRIHTFLSLFLKDLLV